MSETAANLRKRANALREKGNWALAEAEALFARAKWLDANGRTDLQSAILSGKKAEARALIKAGVDPNKTGETDDRPPLVLALEVINQKFSTPLVKALIKAGADANAKRRNGRSVLSQAIFREKFEIALALLKAGADPNEPEARKYLEKEFADWLNDDDGDKEAVVIKAIHRLLAKKH